MVGFQASARQLAGAAWRGSDAAAQVPPRGRRSDRTGGKRVTHDAAISGAEGACPRRHPGWSPSSDYRHHPPRRRHLAGAVIAQRVDHDAQRAGARQTLRAGIDVLWIGSSFTLHWSGGIAQIDHMIQVLSGPSAGECFVVSIEYEGDLPSQFVPIAAKGEATQGQIG